jgi:hypothetical protein
VSSVERGRNESSAKEDPIHELDLATRQLARMRSMNRYYHGRFFADIRASTLMIVALFATGWALTPEVFLLIPAVALLGANQTAFDASYLIFARHYSTVLEDEINSAMRRRVLVGSEMEDRYLFPLGARKIVVAGFGADFTWFGWMTLLYTTAGVGSFGAALALGWPTLVNAGTPWILFYAGMLGTLTLASLLVGWWWFVAGAGERRLAEVTEGSFGRPTREAQRRQWPDGAA